MEYNDVIHDIINYITASPKRIVEFAELQTSRNEKPLKILREHEIRWNSKLRPIKSIKRAYVTMILYFDNKKIEPACNEIINHLKSLRFMLAVELLFDVFSSLERVFQVFQTRDINYFVVDELLGSTKTSLTQKFMPIKAVSINGEKQLLIPSCFKHLIDDIESANYSLLKN
jgi:hypothetical protein